MTKRSPFSDADDPPMPVHKADVTMKFTLIVRSVGTTREWREQYEVRTTDPTQYGREIIARFNASLRPYESARELVGVCDAQQVTPAAHLWCKLTAMTQNNPRGGLPYDHMKCERCGVTGKRFGLQSHVRIDSKYRLKVWQRCDTAMKAKAA